MSITEFSDKSLSAPEYALLVFFVASLSAYDFYWASIGLPILPPLGALGLISYALIKGRPVEFSSIAAGLAMVFILMGSFVWGLAGLNNGQIKGVIGLFIGLAVFFSVRSLWGRQAAMARALDIVLTLHLFLLACQLAVYGLTGNYLDYLVNVTGEPTRYRFVSYGMDLVRFTGAFAEPAHLATFLCFGLASRLYLRGFVFGRFDYLLVAAVLPTVSSYGLALLSVILFLALCHRRISPVRIVGAMSAVALAVLSAALVWPGIAEVMLTRLLNPLGDGSGYLRLVQGFQDFAALSSTQQVWGVGVSNYQLLGNMYSGVSFSLQQLGFIGLGGFLFCLAMLLANSKAPLFALGIVAATLFGSSLLTNAFWWFWLGLLSLDRVAAKSQSLKSVSTPPSPRRNS